MPTGSDGVHDMFPKSEWNFENYKKGTRKVLKILP